MLVILDVVTSPIKQIFTSIALKCPSTFKIQLNPSSGLEDDMTVIII